MHDHSDHHDEIGNSGQAFKGRGDGVSPTLIGLIVLAVATVVFIVQNGGPAEVRFLFLELKTRVWVGVAIALVLGAVLDRLFAIWWRRRKRRE